MESCVEVTDIDAFHDQMLANGIQMTGGDAVPLPEGEKALTNKQSGDRFSYFPLDNSKGMRIMVFERAGSPESVFYMRDAAA